VDEIEVPVLKILWTKATQMADKGLGFGTFVQKQANRLIMGGYRYDKGKPLRRAKYLTRLVAEIEEYKLTGNTEHLINAANYCWLESEKPEHPNSHFKHESKSVTRGKLKMKL
jgi:hypothetical protein